MNPLLLTTNIFTTYLYAVTTHQSVQKTKSFLTKIATYYLLINEILFNFYNHNLQLLNTFFLQQTEFNSCWFWRWLRWHLCRSGRSYLWTHKISTLCTISISKDFKRFWEQMNFWFPDLKSEKLAEIREIVKLWKFLLHILNFCLIQFFV